MALQTDAKCFLVVLVLGGLVVLLNGRIDNLIRLLLSLMFYGIAAFLAYNFMILPLLMKFIELRRRQSAERQQSVPVSEVMARRELSVEKQQSRLRKDANEYEERVMRPKEEARRKKQEKNVKFAVKMFPDGGTRLGQKVIDSQDDTGHDLPGPGSEVGDIVADQSSDEFGDDVMDEKEFVVIAFRLPTGTTIRRKFDQASSCLLVKRFIEKLGYPLNQYRVVKSFQRKVVDLDCNDSLKDAGFLSHTMLVIEEREGLD